MYNITITRQYYTPRNYYLMNRFELEKSAIREPRDFGNNKKKFFLINSFVRTFLICENLLKRRIFKSYKQENLGKLLFTNWTWFNCEINW